MKSVKIPILPVSRLLPLYIQFFCQCKFCCLKHIIFFIIRFDQFLHRQAVTAIIKSFNYIFCSTNQCKGLNLSDGIILTCLELYSNIIRIIVLSFLFYQPFPLKIYHSKNLSWSPFVILAPNFWIPNPSHFSQLTDESSHYHAELPAILI